MSRALTKWLFRLVVGERVIVEDGYFRIPWKQRRSPGESDGTVATATLLVLKNIWSLPPFIGQVRSVLRDLRAAPGLVGYSVQAQSIRGPFWTLSVWSDQPNMRVFVEGDAHLHASIALARHMAQFAARSWLIAPIAVPPSWARAMKECAAVTGE